MPINDDELSQKTSDLMQKITEKQTELQEMSEVLQALKGIHQIKERTFDGDGNPQVTLGPPVDPVTKNPMSVMRRQEIYDSVISKVDSYLA